jgi:SdrD B-like domain
MHGKRKSLGILGVLLGVLAIAATPAIANHINAANVAADCTKFTIVVSGSELDQPNAAVVYTITLTPSGGPPVSITDTIPVKPDDAQLNFSAAVSRNWADFGVTLTGSYTLSGSATLTVNNGVPAGTIPIVFTPVTLACQVSCTGTIGDLVWEDINQNGIQDVGEGGFPNVTVNLYDKSGNKIASTVTDLNGHYLFSGLCAGDYTVAVDQTTLPSGFVPTTCSNQAGVVNNSNCSPSPVNLPTDNSSDLTIDFGYVFLPAGKKVSIGPSSMEGAIKISNGDWVNGGYSFKSNVTGDLTIVARVTITGPCSNGGTDTVIVPLATMTYHNPSSAKDWLPTGDANSVLSWQGAVQVGVNSPAVCGGVGKLDASKGAVYTATVSASPAQPGALVTFRFKYRDPAAKGKPNTNCLDTTDPNRNKADVCGASWSPTKTFDP